MDCINEVADVVYAEARGEGERGMLSVLHVINNRAKNWKLTKCKVVNQPGQFTRGKRRPNDPQWQIAKRLVRNPGHDFTNGAMYFHNRSVRPNWRSLRVVFSFGNHIFYK